MSECIGVACAAARTAAAFCAAVGTLPPAVTTVEAAD
jgi:hypothetical protein